MNLEEDDIILDAAVTASNSTILPKSPRRENDVPPTPLPQISPSSETKELLVNMVNLLQRQYD